VSPFTFFSRARRRAFCAFGSTDQIRDPCGKTRPTSPFGSRSDDLTLRSRYWLWRTEAPPHRPGANTAVLRDLYPDVCPRCRPQPAWHLERTFYFVHGHALSAFCSCICRLARGSRRFPSSCARRMPPSLEVCATCRPHSASNVHSFRAGLPLPKKNLPRHTPLGALLRMVGATPRHKPCAFFIILRAHFSGGHLVGRCMWPWPRWSSSLGRARLSHC